MRQNRNSEFTSGPRIDNTIIQINLQTSLMGTSHRWMCILMACSPMSRAVLPLQTSSRGRQQVPFGSGLTGLLWRFSQIGAVWWSTNGGSQPQTREPQEDAASQLHAASTGSSWGLHNLQGACQGGGGGEVDCVGSQWPRSSISSPTQWDPNSTSSSIVSWPFISTIIRSPLSSWSALRLSELSSRQQLHASSHAASSSSTSTSTSRRFWRIDLKRAISVGQQSALASGQLGSALEHSHVL